MHVLLSSKSACWLLYVAVCHTHTDVLSVLHITCTVWLWLRKLVTRVRSQHSQTDLHLDVSYFYIFVCVRELWLVKIGAAFFFFRVNMRDVLQTTRLGRLTFLLAPHTQTPSSSPYTILRIRATRTGLFTIHPGQHLLSPPETSSSSSQWVFPSLGLG